MLLGILFLLIIVLALHRSNQILYFSKTGKPFVEYDSDGYLTNESYRSHIKVYPNGSTEIDINALVKTRKWAENMKACQELSKRLGCKTYDGLD